MFKGFREFIFRGNVVDLAVAVVIGAAFTNIVNALVKDLITPLIGALGGKPDFSFLRLNFNGTDFLIGDFLNALISFLIIALVIYFAVVMPMSKLLARMKKGEVKEPGTKVCPECLSQIPTKANRCMYCTTVFNKAKAR